MRTEFKLFSSGNKYGFCPDVIYLPKNPVDVDTKDRMKGSRKRRSVYVDVVAAIEYVGAE